MGSLGKHRQIIGPPDVRVRPSQLIVKPSEVRLLHDRSNADYDMNGVLMNPDVDTGAMGSFSALLRPCASLAGLGLKDCLLDWLVSPVSRRPLGVRRSATGLLGVCLLLPSGLDPDPDCVGQPL